MRTFLIALIAAAGSCAQSIVITSPAAGQSVSGTAVTLSSTCTSCPSLYTVEYLIDEETASPKGFAFSETGFQLRWNSYGLYNGNAHIQAIAHNGLGAIIATSPVVRFAVANPYYNLQPPYNLPSSARTPALALADPNTGQILDTGSNAPSTWTGTVNIPISVTGALAGEISGGIQYAIAVGGQVVNGSPPSGSVLNTANPTISFNTAKFTNGPHLVSVVARYYTNALPATAQFVWFGQWKGLVTFSNGSTPMEIRLNTLDKYMRAGDTWQITATGYNTDGSTFVPAGLTYSWQSFALSQNPAPSCSVNSTGLVTATNPFTGDGTCRILVTDSHGFTRMFHGYVNVGVNVLNFGNDGSINTNYVAGKSIFASSIFQDSSNFPASQGGGDYQYTQYGYAKIANGHNANEVGLGNSPPHGGTYSAYLSDLTNNFINAARRFSDPYGFYMTPIGTSVYGNNDSLWEDTKGAAASWSPDHVSTLIMRQWSAVPHVIDMNIGDEINTQMGTNPALGLTKILNAGPLTAISFKAPRVIAGTSDSPAASDCNRALSYTNNGAVAVTMPDRSTLPNSGIACMFHVNNSSASGTVTVDFGTQPVTAGLCTVSGSHCFAPAIAPGAMSGFIYSSLSGTWEFSGQGVRTVAPIGFVSWSNWDYGAGNAGFILTGATTANVNSVSPTHYTRANISYDQDGRGDPDHFEFADSAITSDASLSQGSDPNLSFEYLAAWWMNPSSGKGPCADDPANCDSGPFTSYVDHNAFIQVMSDVNLVSPRVAITWPVSGHTPPLAQCLWMGNCIASSTQMSDFATFYWATTGGAAIDATRSSIWQMAQENTDFASEMRWRQMIMQGPRAFLAETGGVSMNYGLVGYDIPVTACNNENLTLAAPHGLTNVVAGVTRLAIRGSSGAACDGNYYVFAAPDATHLKIARALPTFNASVDANTGTITFEQSGATSSLGYLSSGTTSYINGFGPSYSAGTYCGAAGLSHAGETFTVSGSTGAGSASVNSLRFVYGSDSFDRVTRTLCFHQRWHQLPSVTALGGTANIIPDNDYHAAYSWTTGAFTGPNAIFLNPFWAAGFGATGVRQYVSASDWAGFNPDNAFNPAVVAMNMQWNSGTAVVQQGVHPYWDANGDGRRMWYATGQGTRIVQGKLKYFYQPRTYVPDQGQWVDCTPGRSGVSGNALFCVNNTDDPQTRTFTFTSACSGTSCLISGQNFIRYVGTWKGWTITVFNAGTVSDSLTLPPGAAVLYIFPAAGSEYASRQLSINPADVAGTTDIAIWWGYDAYSLDDQAGQVTECPNGSCSLPVDAALGTVYLRILYLDANGHVLSRSDIQQL